MSSWLLSCLGFPTAVFLSLNAVVNGVMFWFLFQMVCYKCVLGQGWPLWPGEVGAETGKESWVGVQMLRALKPWRWGAPGVGLLSYGAWLGQIFGQTITLQPLGARMWERVEG